MRVTMITTVVHDTDNIIIRDVPVSSTILELEDSNLAIIDTGMAGNPDLLEQLAEYGYAPSDFSLVLNTHLHPDHIGGNRLFTNARILVSRRELAYEYSFSQMLQESEDPLAALRAIGRVVDHMTHQLSRDLKGLVQEYPAASLVGDHGQIEFLEDDPHLPGYISLLQVPGHSIDSLAVLLQGKTRRLVVAGDALYHRDLWREDPLIGLHYNNRLFLQNAEFIARFPDIIIPGHDRAFDNLNRQYLQDDSLMI
ncbi:MAG TPA: MBL fold metallo-hydrolase [Syntrophomonadaceae bacterium]|nr:MBL fold metallo-hydrolase [Syntrophomonadaceae bacterium]